MAKIALDYKTQTSKGSKNDQKWTCSIQKGQNRQIYKKVSNRKWSTKVKNNFFSLKNNGTQNTKCRVLIDSRRT